MKRKTWGTESNEDAASEIDIVECRRNIPIQNVFCIGGTVHTVQLNDQHDTVWQELQYVDAAYVPRLGWLHPNQRLYVF